jgi:hypothetical protein
MTVRKEQKCSSPLELFQRGVGYSVDCSRRQRIALEYLAVLVRQRPMMIAA